MGPTTSGDWVNLSAAAKRVRAILPDPATGMGFR
jgi:hypothetical protein